MNSVAPFIGIDFGTTKSAMARFDPEIGRAEIILNSERKPTTPSLVYFDKNGGEVLVGDRAEDKLRQAKVEQRGFVMSVKRNLVIAAAKVAGNKLYRPVDVAAKILQKLREDAEKVQFHQPVTRAVITYPASFDALLQDKIRQAAMLAGFTEIELLAEPVAAALAYVRTGNEVGEHILVYDFGGGTFDVAVLACIPDGSFALALEPRGLRDCGGDDLDRELYYYCDEIALQMLKRRISLTDDFDLPFLRHCRDRKENLSYEQECTFSDPLPSTNDLVLFEHTVSRAAFEQRIRKYIEHTSLLTQEVMRDANARKRRVDTVVLIGGSSSVPLVQQLLAGTLPVPPKEWQYRDYAVALGAAYHAQHLWGRERLMQSSPPVLSPTNREEYRQAVRSARATGRLTHAQLDELSAQASRSGLSRNEAADVEREVMGDTAVGILARQHNPPPPAQPGRLDQSAPSPSMYSQSGRSRNLGSIIGQSRTAKVLIGLIVVLVIISSVAIIAAKNNSGSAPGPNVSPTTPAQTTTPTSAPVPNATWDVILNTSTSSLTYNNYTVSDTAGHHFLVVTLSFANNTSQTLPINGTLLDLQDSTGNHYSEDQASTPQQTLYVSAGQTLQAQFAFVVPDSQCQYTLVFTDPTGAPTSWTITVTGDYCTG